ncbi:hypothetical protein [Paenibacillus sacheonensis]|uniref:Uncharacterized protein n=1 Tax=Paenibacillus sacheonensis TaxID=742054 RepID=A0A7X4YRS0_9BACL|nr:hypothetical protein [Paenibacillus sacheonensis]MBM7567557.1 putative Mrr-cat superfamily restriction endonuclease [Paenibacillus sacheonensis]NBC71338.1 hypothetical protein [Paenibacillus sacheonensis]
MQVFRMRVDAEGKNGLPYYLDNHYVSFGLPGVGDMTGLGKAELLGRLASEHRSEDVQELARRADEHHLFAHVMQDGDYIIVDDGERLYLGDLGDYYYLGDCGNDEDRSAHRRGVTWLRSLQREELQPELLAFLGEQGKLGAYEHSVTREQLEHLLTKPAAAGSGWVDEATIREAVGVLKAALRSDDAERRERAAVAILQAARMS